MENGFFQTRLGDIQFAEDSTRVEEWETKISTTLPPIPTEIPLAKSNSLEALIHQNEDLSARLKVCLRRLSILESENYELLEKSKSASLGYSNLQDQLLIWKEKETAWQGRIHALESQVQEFTRRFPEYQTMQDTIERYKRYQEKIRTQVKPYINQLKEYSENLISQIRSLNSELSHKESFIIEQQKKFDQARKEFEQTLAASKQNENNLTRLFEIERAQLIHDIQNLKETNSVLESKTIRLHKSLERQDDLENEVVALKRVKEELENQVSNNFNQHQSNIRSIKQELTEKNLLLEVKSKELEDKSKILDELTKQREQSEEQLQSLRYLWSQKSEECEKMRLRIESLEKLNAELSRKLNETRKGEVFI
ncbi:MAG: hypothetical protein BroJett040_12450 [Oligoflexia bacterium]|nr:MAG: hypothetical protein BroJett040_12450 [Oligoflexia bacterium]